MIRLADGVNLPTDVEFLNRVVEVVDRWVFFVPAEHMLCFSCPAVVV